MPKERLEEEDDALLEDDTTLEGEDGEEGDDAGLDDDEGGGEGTGEEDHEAEGQEGLDDDGKPRQGRASKTIQGLKKSLKELRARDAQREQELQALRNHQPQNNQRQQSTDEEDPEKEAAKLAGMTDYERLEYKLDKSARTHQRELRRLEVQNFDRADKASFDAKCAGNPRYRKYAAEVEQVLANTRREGRDIGFTREQVLQFVLGQKVLAHDSKGSRQRQKQQGRQNIERQNARPPNDRSDQGGQRRRAGSGNSRDDLAARLDGQII